MKVRAKLTIRNATLLEARERLGLTQKETAQRANISLSFLQDLEKFGYRKNWTADDERLMRLCSFLGVEPEEVLPEALIGKKLQERFIATETVKPERLLAFTNAYKSRNLLPSPADEAEIKEEVELIRKFIKMLSYREREIITLLFGFGEDGYEYTLKETARIFKMTGENVRMIKARALRKIKVMAEDARIK